MTFKKKLVLSCIESADFVSAQSAFEKLLTDIGIQKDAEIVPVIYEIGEKFREKGQFKPALSAYKYIADNFPDNEKAVWAQRGVGICFIALRAEQDAKSAVDKLLKDFDKDPNISQAVFETADAYYWFGKNADAQRLYRNVIDSWPAAEYAVWAQMGLAISYVADGNDTAAAGATEKLINNYRENSKLPEALFYIAGRYDYSRKYEKSQELYTYITGNFPASTWAGDARFETAKNVVYKFLDANDEPNTPAAIDNFIDKYKERADLPAVVYDFAVRADKQNKNEPNEFTKTLYEIVVEKFPQSPQAAVAKLNISKMNAVLLNNAVEDANVIEDVNRLIVDFKNQPALPAMLYQVGEKYFKRAYESRRQLNNSAAGDNFQKAAGVWEKLVQQFPGCEKDILAYSYHGLSICFSEVADYAKATEYYNKILSGWPDEIDDFEYENRNFISANNYCGAYVVWHCLRYYGLQSSIGEIAEQMGIETKGYSSIADIVGILNEKGIVSQGVKLNLNNLKALTMPFIQYQAAVAGEPLGHFVLCIPTGNGKAVVLDGAKEPWMIDLASYKADNVKQTRWDGTAVVIDGIKAGLLQAVMMDRNIMSQLAAVWLDPQSAALYSKLPAGEQLTLTGGWNDWDCHSIGSNCKNIPACSCDEDCWLYAFACDDGTQEGNCVKTYYGVIPCTYDPAHYCRPQVALTTFCNAGYRCGVVLGNHGDCNPVSWIHQCHNGW